MNKFLCKVEASMPDSSPDRVNRVFEFTVKADDVNEAQMLAEEKVDREIRSGKLDFPYGEAEQIDCFFIQKIG